MQKIVNKLLGIAIFALAIVLVFVSGKLGNVSASAPSGLPATIATTSAYAVGPEEPMVYNYGNNQNRLNCASRIVSTGISAVVLTFGGTSSSTATSTLKVGSPYLGGHLQLASTTVAYDSGIYGCGFIGLSSYASTSIIISTSI
jgi:hypothetical protein